MVVTDPTQSFRPLVDKNRKEKETSVGKFILHFYFFLCETILFLQARKTEVDAMVARKIVVEALALPQDLQQAPPARRLKEVLLLTVTSRHKVDSNNLCFTTHLFQTRIRMFLHQWSQILSRVLLQTHLKVLVMFPFWNQKQIFWCESKYLKPFLKHWILKILLLVIK